MRREWKYETGTDIAVQDALLRLLSEKALADVTVAELAREAHVSRSTFYEHYGNPADVYDDLAKRFSRDLSPLMEQVACARELQPEGKPFCMRLRESGPFAPVVNDDRFLGTLLADGGYLEKHDLYNLVREAGYTDAQAKALCSFQMAGCFSAARASGATDAEWDDTKAVIDRFILGGIAALLASRRSATR